MEFEVLNPDTKKTFLLYEGPHLGRGAWASVQAVYHRGPASQEIVVYAVKTFFVKPRISAQCLTRAIHHEANIGLQLDHPHVLQTFALGLLDGQLACLMEFCGHGDIFDLIWPPRPEQARLCLVKQLLLGMSYMHSKGIAHCDIKPENMLLGGDGLLKIADFGYAVVYRETPDGEEHMVEPPASGPVGTAAYLAPEVWSCVGDDPPSAYDAAAADVWACGLTGRELLGKFLPWEYAVVDEVYAEDGSPDNRFARFMAGWMKFWDGNEVRPISPNAWPVCGHGFRVKEYPAPEMLRVLLGMLNPNPAARLTIDEALEDPYIQAVECCSPAVSPYNQRGATHDHRPAA
ncbi:putative serine/threonine protein kinase [Aspergillus homomorphus CBS 101889]|uniref:non-specific serine/threonine protein kinase n=1 Tax=Aspergillus homomorphus (strain CBS 101889) TaxID=1450537 RepID=A0A395HK09_ASPHC|nr:kinase-like protein [Aspergillus homomorphus CBS 101889]RAL06594.1 kinase-like protein [Aspergillus homomorphus CBS 101889]